MSAFDTFASDPNPAPLTIGAFRGVVAAMKRHAGPTRWLPVPQEVIDRILRWTATDAVAARWQRVKHMDATRATDWLNRDTGIGRLRLPLAIVEQTMRRERKRHNRATRRVRLRRGR